MSSSPAPDHYSYAHYADPTTAQSFDALRFGGPIGALVADAQAEVLLKFVGLSSRHGFTDSAAVTETTGATHATSPTNGPDSSRTSRGTHPTVLDVGTGTGRAALLLARSGAHVTGVDASEAMLSVARQRAAAQGVRATFRVGDAHALEFPDRSFDVAVSLRVLMHTPDWRRCIAELCRVADSLVVVDYPSAASVASVESVGRKAAHALGIRTEPYRVFLSSTIARAFARHGFRVRSAHRQFVLPIAVHKAAGSRRLTVAVEGALARVGLLDIFGSPVTIVAERCGSS